MPQKLLHGKLVSDIKSRRTWDCTGGCHVLHLKLLIVPVQKGRGLHHMCRCRFCVFLTCGLVSGIWVSFSLLGHGRCATSYPLLSANFRRKTASREKNSGCCAIFVQNTKFLIVEFCRRHCRVKFLLLQWRLKLKCLVYEWLACFCFGSFVFVFKIHQQLEMK